MECLLFSSWIQTWGRAQKLLLFTDGHLEKEINAGSLFGYLTVLSNRSKCLMLLRSLFGGENGPGTSPLPHTCPRFTLVHSSELYWKQSEWCRTFPCMKQNPRVCDCSDWCQGTVWATSETAQDLNRTECISLYGKITGSSKLDSFPWADDRHTMQVWASPSTSWTKSHIISSQRHIQFYSLLEI